MIADSLVTQPLPRNSQAAKDVAVNAAFLLVLLVVWQLLSAVMRTPFVPGPLLVFQAFVTLAVRGDYQQVRRLITQDFLDAFREVDVIVTPTTPTPAFLLGEKSDDPLAMYLADIYTVTADLAGIPGISVPCGQTREKLPIGLQILGKHFDEAAILRLAHAYEQA